MTEICTNHGRVVQASEGSKSGPKSSKNIFFQISLAINPKIKSEIIFGFYAPKNPQVQLFNWFWKVHGVWGPYPCARVRGRLRPPRLFKISWKIVPRGFLGRKIQKWPQIWFLDWWLSCAADLKKIVLWRFGPGFWAFWGPNHLAMIGAYICHDKCFSKTKWLPLK